MARGSARASGTRPAWVRLGILALLMVFLCGAMALSGHWTPKLGLDLQGGTSVTLSPRSTQAGTKVDSRAVDKAVDIIRERVNGLGVAEAEVKRTGDQIEISVPGRGRNDVVDLVGQTAELRFREVYTATDATPAPAPTPTTPDSGAPTDQPSASPTAAASAGADATASATAAPTAAATAAPTETTRPRPVDQSLLAAAAPATATSPTDTAPTSPSVVAPLTTAPVDPTAPADPSATDAAAATPPQAVIDAFQALTCAPSDVRSAAAATDAATDWIASCDRDGLTKYLLKPATVVGTDVKTASAGLDSSGGGTSRVTTGQWQIRVEFTGSGQQKFTDLTEATVGQQVAIVLDGVVQSAPRIDVRIPGDATISGSFTQSDAEDLANVLQYGSLPIAFENEQAQSISPTLGRDSLRGGLLAGALGLGLVVLYAFFYYRALGVVVITSLAVSAALIYASVVLLGQLIGFTLTLAGIAGLIVSIGVTADSFVVYFERVKDEAKGGRTVRAAVDRAWPSARRTMLSADTVSFLAAAVLYVLSIGSVRGFAFTLGLSTLIDVLIMFIFTRPMLQILVRRRFFGGRFSGLTSPAGVRRQPLGKRDPTATRAGTAGSGTAVRAGTTSSRTLDGPSSSKDRPRRAGEKREY